MERVEGRSECPARLRSEYAGDPDMRQLVDTFVDELADRIAAIQAAFETEDLARLRTIAHQLKGAAGGYGFPVIGLAAEQVERLLANAESSDLARKVEDLVRLCRSALPYGDAS